MGTKLARKTGGRPTKRPDIQTLDLLYQRYTAKEIADIFAVPENTVRNWIQHYRRQEHDLKNA